MSKLISAVTAAALYGQSAADIAQQGPGSDALQSEHYTGTLQVINANRKVWKSAGSSTGSVPMAIANRFYDSPRRPK